MFCSLSSGSSGNCYLVASEETSLLVDAGISGRNIRAGLATCGLEMADVDGVLITHEHTDHIKSLQVVHNQAKAATIYTSKGTRKYINAKMPKVSPERVVEVEPSDGAWMIGDIEVTPVSLSHDAVMPLGFSFRKGDSQISIITDTGEVTEEIFQVIKESDLLVLEANYEENVLMIGPYPYNLKVRIKGKHGHLSNEDAANCIVRVLAERNNINMPIVALAHTSKENNTPDLAYATVENILYDSNYMEGRDYSLKVLLRDLIGDVIIV